MTSPDSGRHDQTVIRQNQLLRKTNEAQSGLSWRFTSYRNKWAIGLYFEFLNVIDIHLGNSKVNKTESTLLY